MSSMLLPLAQNIEVQGGGRSPGTVSKSRVFHLQRSISTTHKSSMAFKSVTSAVPQCFALYCRQSGQHASYSLLPNSVPLYDCYPSMYKSLNLLVHLKIATMSDITSHTENGLLVKLWIKQWIQFSDWVQFCSQQSLSSSTILLH